MKLRWPTRYERTRLTALRWLFSFPPRRDDCLPDEAALHGAAWGVIVAMIFVGAMVQS